MFHNVGILVELHSIRIPPLSLVGGNLDTDFSSPELACRIDLQEIVCLLFLPPYLIRMLPFLLLTLTYLKISRLVGAISIKCIETRVKASSYDLTIANHVAIYWTEDYVLYVGCFNGNISSFQYFLVCTRL